MSRDRYVIECRDVTTGALSFTGEQPEAFFGMAAITGITEDQMAKRILSARADAVLTGDSVSLWPRTIDLRWTARRKTW